MPIFIQNDKISQYSLASYAADAAKAIILAANSSECDNDTIIKEYSKNVKDNLIDSDFSGITVRSCLKYLKVGQEK